MGHGVELHVVAGNFEVGSLDRGALGGINYAGVEIQHCLGHIDVEVGLIMLTKGDHLQVGEANMLLVDAGRGGRFETAQQMALEIVMREDEALGFVADGERDVF